MRNIFDVMREYWQRREEKHEEQLKESKLKLMARVRSDAELILNTYVRNIVCDHDGVIKSLEVLRVHSKHPIHGSDWWKKLKCVFKWSGVHTYFQDSNAKQRYSENVMVEAGLEALGFAYYPHMCFEAYSVFQPATTSKKYTYESLKEAFVVVWWKAMKQVCATFEINNARCQFGVEGLYWKDEKQHLGLKGARLKIAKQIEYEASVGNAPYVLNRRGGVRSTMCKI